MFNQIEADKLTIGQHIAHTANITAFTDDVLMSVAEEYINVPEEHIHSLLKTLKLGFSASTSIGMLNYINKTSIIERCITKAVRVTNGSAVCSLKLYKDPQDVAHEPFYVTDVLGYCKNFVVLDGLESMQPYAGRSLINQVIHMVDVPILIQAGFLHYGDYEIEARDSVDSGVLDKLVPYYESIGFKNINDIVGNYEDSVVMLYSEKDIFQGK